MSKKRCSVYFRNRHINPSNYYRIYQYLNNWDCNFVIHDSAPCYLYETSLNSRRSIKRKTTQALLYFIMNARVFISLLIDCFRKPDVIIIQRELIPHYILWINYFLLWLCCGKSELVWDFDDDIFIQGEISKREARLLTKKSKRIIVIGEYLKNLLPLDVHHKVFCVPTTDGTIYKNINKDTIEWKKEQLNKEVSLVWIGTSSGISMLNAIIPSLDKAAKELKNAHKRLVLICVSGKELDAHPEHLIIKNIKWSREQTIKVLQKVHFGIMPLKHDMFSLGKGGFKLIQYMSARVPIIASNVGFNNNIVNNEIGILVNDEKDMNGWEKAVIDIVDNKDYDSISEKAFEVWKDKYSYEKNIKDLSKFILGD